MQMIKQIPTEYQTFDYKPLNKKATPNYDNTRLVGQGFDNTMNAIKGVSRTVSGIVGMAGGKMGGMGGGLGKSGLMTQGNVDMTSKIMGGQAGGILLPKKLGKFGEVLEQTNFLKKGVRKLNYKFKSKKAIGVDSLVDGATTFIDSKKIKDEFGSEDEGLAAVSGALNYGKDGAAIGMTVGGPVGAAIGAGVGAVAGGIGSAINAASKNKAILNAKTIAENQATAERVNAYYQNNGQMGESYKQKNAKTGLKNIKYKYQTGGKKIEIKNTIKTDNTHVEVKKPLLQKFNNRGLPINYKGDIEHKKAFTNAGGTGTGEVELSDSPTDILGLGVGLAKLGINSPKYIKKLVQNFSPKNLKVSKNATNWMKERYADPNIKSKIESYRENNKSGFINTKKEKVDKVKFKANIDDSPPLFKLDKKDVFINNPSEIEFKNKNFFDLLKDKGVKEYINKSRTSKGVSYGDPDTYTKKTAFLPFNKKGLESVRTHEQTHALTNNGNAFGLEEEDLLLSPFKESSNSYKLKAHTNLLNSSEKYHLNPTEIHARLNQSKYELGHSPNQNYTLNDLETSLKNNNMNGMGTYIKDKNTFVKMANKMYSAAPIVAGKLLKKEKEIPKMKNGIKTYKYKTGSKELLLRKNGKYSQRGLWDNIRANKGSGKEPSKEMVKQENKIKKYSNGTREILTEDREAHFVKKGKKYILLNDTTKPVTHTNNKNEGRNAIVVAKNKYKLKDIINHNHSVSDNPEDSLILPEKSSIVTANNGMNKLALDAYKKGNYKMIDDIINKMPTDGKRKYYDGTEELEKDSFGYDNTGQAGGRTVEKDTYRENKKNEEYRKKIQSDKTFRMSELKKGNVKYTQDGKLNYKPKGGNSKNQWEFAGQVKRKEEPNMNQLEPKKAGLNIEPTIIDPNSIPKMPVKTDIQSTKNVENKPNTGFNIADNLSLRISDINNIVKGSSPARTNQIFNPDLKLQNYRDLSNPTRLKSEQAKNANVNNAKETSAGLSSNFRNNAQNAVNEDYNRQQEINNYEIGRADAIQTNNVDSINKYSINEAEQKAAKQVADFQEIDSKESQFHKGLEGVDENNFRNRKLNQENNLAEQGYNIDRTREATNRLVIEDSIRNGRQTTPTNTETLTKEQQDYRNNLSDKDKEKLGIKQKHGSKMLKLKSKYKMR